jgi:hypothetical protein
MRTVAATALIVFVVVLGGCSAGASSSTAGLVAVRGTATAGPTCPVERPGDSSCAPRPVAGATIVVQTGAGAEITRLKTAADGTFSIDLAAGDYRLVPQPVEGLLGTADQVTVTVPAGGSPAPGEILIRYDTGIR